MSGLICDVFFGMQSLSKRCLYHSATWVMCHLCVPYPLVGFISWLFVDSLPWWNTHPLIPQLCVCLQSCNSWIQRYAQVRLSISWVVPFGLFWEVMAFSGCSSFGLSSSALFKTSTCWLIVLPHEDVFAADNHESSMTCNQETTMSAVFYCSHVLIV